MLRNLVDLCSGRTDDVVILDPRAIQHDHDLMRQAFVGLHPENNLEQSTSDNCGFVLFERVALNPVGVGKFDTDKGEFHGSCPVIGVNNLTVARVPGAVMASGTTPSIEKGASDGR